MSSKRYYRKRYLTINNILANSYFINRPILYTSVDSGSKELQTFTLYIYNILTVEREFTPVEVNENMFDYYSFFLNISESHIHPVTQQSASKSCVITEIMIFNI